MLSHRPDFPIFQHQPELVYLDSAATSQKPQVVIDAVRHFYEQGNANVHRGLYPLSLAASAAYEDARADVARFIGTTDPAEIIFTRGATEAINLVADTLTRDWQPGEVILLSELEHHANLVPWQQAAQRRGLELRFVKLTKTGEIDLEDLTRKLEGVRLVALTHCSNVLGTITPVDQVKKILAEQGSEALLLLDAAQSAPHMTLDVAALGCDFLAFSGHKLYGPSGIGVLWGRKELLEAVPPYQTGGDMVKTVTSDGAIWNTLPWKFEAGTPNMEGAVGLGAAVRYLEGIGMKEVAAHCRKLSEYAQKALAEVPEVQIVGQPTPESGIISFVVEGVHPHDLAQLLGERNICIRAGHHCAAPLHAALGLTATARISFGLYNEVTDVDAFVAALREIISDIRHA